MSLLLEEHGVQLVALFWATLAGVWGGARLRDRQIVLAARAEVPLAVGDEDFWVCERADADKALRIAEYAHFEDATRRLQEDR